jgi:hypothetical protein
MRFWGAGEKKKEGRKEGGNIACLYPRALYVVMGTRQDETTFRVVSSRLVFRGSRFRLVSGPFAKSREVSRLWEKGEI